MVGRIGRCGVAFAAWFFLAPAWAQQGSVVLYGVLDEGVERVHGLATDGSNSAWRVGSGTAASRWGIKGSEDPRFAECGEPAGAAGRLLPVEAHDAVLRFRLHR
jgi:hypothetical protein